MLSFYKLVSSFLRRLRAVLPLCITISLLFYYTFQNEINMLNSFAETEYIPSLSNNAGNESELGESSFNDNGKNMVASELSDPNVLKAKNKYFPLLISESNKESFIRNSERDQAAWTNLLLTHKERYPVLYELSLPTPTEETINEKKQLIQNSTGSSNEKMLTELRLLLQKSLDHDKSLSRAKEELKITWPIKLIDMLDTLYIMGKFQQFEEAVELIDTIDFRLPPAALDIVDVSDLTTKALGGLLSAYELSSEESLLSHAKLIADFILRSFDTPNKIPIVQYPWRTEYQNRFPYQHAEIGALSKMVLELTRLSQITKNNKYFAAAFGIYDTIANSKDEFALDYMFPDHIDASGCQLMDAEAVAKGDHVRQSKVMKSIDENFNYVYCQQDGTVKISPDDRSSKRQLFVMNSKTQPVYENLVNLYSLLHRQDIFTLNSGRKTALKEDNEDEKSEEHADEINRRDGLNKVTLKPSAEIDENNRKTSRSSKKYFINAMNHIRDLMTVPAETPMNKNVTIISSLQSRSWYSASKNELRVELKRHGDMFHESCNLAATLAMGSKIFNVTNFMADASKIAESCFELNKFFEGAMPEQLYLDICDKENCKFSKSNKIQQVQLGLYGHTEDDELNDKLNEVVVSPKNSRPDLSEDSGLHKLQRMIMFSKKRSKSWIDVKMSEINKNKMTWEKYPERPFWINKMGKKTLLSSHTVKSIFYMYRITGEQKWRDMGEDLFRLTLETMKKTNQRAKGVWEVEEIKYNNLDDNYIKIPSEWYSQTLKYYYLLFDDTTNYDLDTFVITSGGHFLRKDWLQAI